MKLVIIGKFTEEDLKKFAKVLRGIEMKRSELVYTMFIDENGLTFEQAKKLTERIYSSTLNHVK
jgi:hypothetical protein